jgi:rod shape-determining protein MreC
MAGFLSKHRNIPLLAGLFAFAFILFALSARNINHLAPLERVAVTAVAPFQRALAWTWSRAAESWDNYIGLVDVRGENVRLRRKIDALILDNAGLTERMTQFERIERLISFPQLDSTTYEVVRVVARDTSGLARLITIDEGSSQGLADNMTVITHRGLVGRIIRTSPSVSRVLLITDVRSAVDALAQESRDGMVASGANGAILSVRYLMADAKAKNGDRVVSSGLGGIYPKGLLIGILRDVKREKEDLFATARIIPLADLDRLEEVLVIKGSPSAGFNERKWR